LRQPWPPIGGTTEVGRTLIFTLDSIWNPASIRQFASDLRADHAVSLSSRLSRALEPIPRFCAIHACP
jgi:hypothetical protein